MCPAPSGSLDGECNCTTNTCGAGMLDARAAITAVAVPSTPRALIFSTPAIASPGTDIAIDGTTSIGGAGSVITGYQWTLIDDGGIAQPLLSSSGSTVTVRAVGEGSFRIQLQVTDANNLTDTRNLVVSVGAPAAQQPSPSNGGGGGSLSWPWLFALGVAVAVLRPRRSL